MSGTLVVLERFDSAFPSNIASDRDDNWSKSRVDDRFVLLVHLKRLFYTSVWGL